MAFRSVDLCKSLKTNTTLTSLDLSSTCTGNYWTLPAIAEALVHNTTLSTLNLNSTEINTNDLVLIPMALKVNSTLTSLDLGNNFIRESDAKAFAQALETNTTLTSLNFDRIYENYEMPHLETLQSIEAALQRNRDLKP